MTFGSPAARWSSIPVIAARKKSFLANWKQIGRGAMSAMR